MTASELHAATLRSLAGQAVISVEEAGCLLHLSPNCAYDAVRRGELPALRFGRRLVVPVPALVLRLLGVDDVPAFLAGLGLRDLEGLLSFLAGDGGQGIPPVGNALAYARIRASSRQGT